MQGHGGPLKAGATGAKSDLVQLSGGLGHCSGGLGQVSGGLVRRSRARYRLIPEPVRSRMASAGPRPVGKPLSVPGPSGGLTPDKGVWSGRRRFTAALAGVDEPNTGP